ncbi:hypothetical protein XENOCAPTIV_020597 [Xenoophorus captivus]|uniref:Uncharacterized protein n=1 Tax=Xenoophorus captivus TaxID=1517983 RepID=A0ABV0RN52_9TELE
MLITLGLLMPGRGGAGLRLNLSTLIQSFFTVKCWYNRLYINFTLRRHIFFFLLQTYFPATLMVMLSWVSFWIDQTKKKGTRSFRIIQNTHTIDTYSRMIFPGAYILFNLIYWCVYC